MAMLVFAIAVGCECQYSLLYSCCIKNLVEEVFLLRFQLIGQ